MQYNITTLLPRTVLGASWSGDDDDDDDDGSGADLELLQVSLDASNPVCLVSLTLLSAPEIRG